MKSPTSTNPKNVLLDTNVLSKFAKINRLDLLPQIFPPPIYITPMIRQELEVGLSKRFEYLSQVLNLVDAGQIEVLPTNHDKQNLSSKLQAGESEAIPICYKLGLIFITHDRKAINYCDRMGIGCVPLTDLIEELQVAGLLTALEVDKLLT